MAEIKDCCSCIYETRSTFTEPCVSCGVDFLNYMAKPAPKRKRKTNADRIRRMTDEELADWLVMNGDGSDYQTWLEWLKEVATDAEPK